MHEWMGVGVHEDICANKNGDSMTTLGVNFGFDIDEPLDQVL